MKLKDKTIIITGASSGIGKAFAKLASKDKVTLILASRNRKKLEQVKIEVEKNGSRGIVVPTDVTKDEQIKELFLKSSRKGRVIDAVFNNAGLGYIGNIYELTRTQIRKMIDVNLTGMIMVTKYASEVMVRQRYGHIIMTSSLAGLITLPQWSVYVATKWGITGFADSIRHELKRHNVTISTVHPGLVNTSFFSEKKADLEVANMQDTISPEKVADAVYKVIFTDRKKVIIPKMAKNYALLYKFLPKIMSKFLQKQASEFDYGKSNQEDEKGFSYVKCVTCKDEK